MMIWKNLKENKCPFPYCQNDISFDYGLQEIICTVCSFHIDIKRGKDIAEARQLPTRPEHIKHNNWQNLHEGKCPACKSWLRQEFELHVCINSECPFKIREDRLQQILNDPCHSANLFYKGKEHAG